ncbi:hypothetical protein EG329_006374 [Mollisiaceae sp. DMI_Dod_QoI]|nr:hypothetical protein EG329_006374 [Helotiales sp. DMI_Dod_QoI]
MAFSHHFLLHGMLAFSALHLARLQPDRKASLYADASAHHDAGLRLFRTAMMELSPQNCDACFAYSSILVVYTWASSDQTGDLFFPDTSTAGRNISVGWASLLRGVQTLLVTAAEWIGTGSMGIMLYPFTMELELAMIANLEVTAKLTSLNQLWNSSPGKFSPANVEALNETVALLLEAHGLLTSSSVEVQVDTLSIALGWPIRVPEAFLAMVIELKPEALVVLAHYSLLLNHVDHVWFMYGMSGHLLRSIHSRLGREWQSWISWLF